MGMASKRCAEGALRVRATGQQCTVAIVVLSLILILSLTLAHDRYVRLQLWFEFVITEAGV